MKAVAIIVNIFFPGIGTLIVGKIGQGIAQLILFSIGVVFNFTIIGAIVGVPLCIGVWIWALVTVANSPVQPVQVVIVHKDGSPPA